MGRSEESFERHFQRPEFLAGKEGCPLSQSQLAQLCVLEKKVRENYYSETYRSVFRLNGVRREWDVTHISIPFNAEKEAEAMARFGIGKTGLTAFYEHLSEHLTAEAAILSVIHGGEEQEEGFSSNVAEQIYVETVPKEQRGTDIYYVTEAMEPLAGSVLIQRDSITLLSLLQLGARFTQMLKLANGMGIHIGAFDLDTVCLQHMENGKEIIKFASLLYGFQEGNDLLPPLESTPPAAGIFIQSGEPPTLSTDLKALCGLLWTLASGKHYTSAPDYENIPHPLELAELLNHVRSSTEEDSTITLKEMQNGLFQMIRKIRRGEMENPVIPLEAPVWPGIPESEGKNQNDAKKTSAPLENEPQAAEYKEASTCPVTELEEQCLPAAQDTGDAELSENSSFIQKKNESDMEIYEDATYYESFSLEAQEEQPVSEEIHPQSVKKENLNPGFLILLILAYMFAFCFTLILLLELCGVLDPIRLPLIYELGEGIRYCIR